MVDINRSRLEELVDSNTLDDISHDAIVAWLNGDTDQQDVIEQILLDVEKP
jgi:hypothetical protein